MFNKRKCGCNNDNFGYDYGRQNMSEPIIEPMINNCVEKDFYCEVPHDW